MPILVSTLTFVIVFYPVVFLSGLARFLFTPLAVAASLAIIASYVLALTLVPAYCARFLRTAKKDPAEAAASKKTSAFSNLLSKLLRAPVVTVLVSFVLLAGAGYMMTGMGTELFPPVDPGQFTINVRMPTGTRIEKTEEAVERIEQRLIEEIGAPDPGYALGKESHPDSNLQILISNIGVLMDWPAAYTPNTSSMDAFMLVQVKGKAGHTKTFDLVQILRDKLTAEFREEVTVASLNAAGYRRELALAESTVAEAMQSLSLNMQRIRAAEGLPIEALQAAASAKPTYLRTITASNEAQLRLLRAVGSVPSTQPE
ncbi:MAG: HAE1 family hydrophobic/amphiphilic exporter-1 [Planctomycetota bacterium]|jgi:HAE1 family hydrophobic/amphiphilic exporter-1